MLYSTVPGPSSGRLGPFVGSVFQDIRPAEGRSELPARGNSRSTKVFFLCLRSRGGVSRAELVRSASYVPTPFAKHKYVLACYFIFVGNHNKVCISINSDEKSMPTLDMLDADGWKKHFNVENTLPGSMYRNRHVLLGEGPGFVSRVS